MLFELRLPRVLLAGLVGAGLALAGASAQGLFRNPLADPALIGVAMGAVAGGVVWIVFSQTLLPGVADWLRAASLPLVAIAAGLATTVAVYRLASRGGSTDVATLLLGGIAINALAAAITGICVFASDDQQLRDLSFWTLGSFSAASWSTTATVAVLLLIPGIAILRRADALNALALGEDNAYCLGTDIAGLKRQLIVGIAIVTSASVAFCGVIAFVGLVAPHMVRLVLGPDHRVLLPGSALLGAALLVLADLAARTLVVPAELPVGIVTSLIGAPFFLYLLARRRGIAGF